MRLRGWACVAIALLVVSARAVHAQTAVIGGTVVADSNGRAVPEANVTLPELKRSARANYLGEFRFTMVPAGRYLIEIRHLGYAVFRDTIEVRDGQKIDAEFLMREQPLSLDSVVVTAKTKLANPFLEEFEARRKVGLGHFIDETTLRKEADNHYFATYLASKFPGLSVAEKKAVGQSTWLSSGRSSCTGRTFSCTTSSTCMIALYIDGNPVYVPGRTPGPPNLEDYKPEDFAAVEWYAGGSSIPPQYGGTGANCGVLLLWHRNR